MKSSLNRGPYPWVRITEKILKCIDISIKALIEEVKQLEQATRISVKIESCSEAEAMLLKKEIQKTIHKWNRLLKHGAKRIRWEINIHECNSLEEQLNQ